VQLVNSITSLFIEPTENHIFSESDDINFNMLKIDKWSQKKNSYCEFEWEVKGELKDYWVIVRSTSGMLTIISPDKSLFCPEMEALAVIDNNNQNKKFENSSYVHQGIISVSNMRNKENIITLYAVTPDGKTWYKRQIKIDSTKLLNKVSDVYRTWSSSDGQNTMTARLLSIEGIEDFDVDEIDVAKLKDKMITIEKKENKKLIKVKFKNLSTKDQEYLIKQIKTTE
jgi:hypothetical protein